MLLFSSCFLLLLLFIPSKRRRRRRRRRRRQQHTTPQQHHQRLEMATSTTMSTTAAAISTISMSSPTTTAEELIAESSTINDAKDLFLKSIEQLTGEQRSSQRSVAKALRLPLSTIRYKANKYEVKMSDLTTQRKALTEEQKVLLREGRNEKNRKKRAEEAAERKVHWEEREALRREECQRLIVKGRALEEEAKRWIAKETAEPTTLSSSSSVSLPTTESVASSSDEEAIEKVRALVKKILQKKHKQPGGPYNKNKKARKAKEQTKSERAVHNALTVLNPNGKTFKICHDHEVNERNKFRTSLLVSEEKTRGLSRVFAECGTELSEFGLCKLEAYPEATSDILTAEMESLVEYLNNPTKATSNVLLVGPKKHIIDPKRLGPLLRRRIEVSKSGKFGETTVITDNVKVQKYDGSGGKHRDRKVTHTIIHHGQKCFLLARVLEKINGGKLKFFRESDGKDFSIRIEKGEFLIMMAHAGLCHHNSEEGLYTIVTDFVLPYDAIRREREGGVDGKLEQMIRKFAKDIPQHL